MEQSSDRPLRRRASLVAAPAPVKIRAGAVRNRSIAIGRRGPAAPTVAVATRPQARFAPAPRWRPPLRLVASNATPRLRAVRPRPQLRLIGGTPAESPAPALSWSVGAATAWDVEAPEPRRATQVLVALMAAGGLVALASSLGRLLGG